MEHDDQSILSHYFNFELPSMEGNLLEPIYYRKFGLRRAVQLVAPTLRNIADLSVPRQSIVHHLPTDESLYGMDQDDPFVANESRVVSVEHVLNLTSTKGPPRPLPTPPMTMVREYHRRNRNMKRVFNMKSVLRNPVSPLVVNYGLLPHRYRYTKTFMAPYNKWFNIQNTIYDTMKRYLAETNRSQYLPCYLPTRLPSVQQLTRGSKAFNASILKIFNSPSSLFILDFWKWLGEQRDESLWHRFSREELARINLIWIESGKWMVINLGLLDSWRKSSEYPKAMIAPKQMQRRFLRLLMFLFETRTVGSDEIPEIAPPIKIKVETEEGSKTLTVKEGMNIDILPEDEAVEETAKNVDAIDDAISKDLDALDALYEDAPELDDVSEDNEDVAEDTPSAPQDELSDTASLSKQRSLESGVMEIADQYAKKGLLSAAEYRRVKTLSESYKKIKDPYGSDKTLKDFIHVDPKDLKLKKAIKLPDDRAILDKSVLQSSLIDFDQRYINEFLQKDIVRSVLNLQMNGIAVTGYSVKEVEDCMNHFETHHIQLTPVKGRPSTISLKVPKIHEDGTYYANGVKTRLRKQRGDVPIRKIKPSQVALTSYYCKTFVTRSEKKVHDYSGWLVNQIVSMGLDAENRQIEDLLMADVFDSYQALPRVYSILSQRVRSFKAGAYEFFLDYGAREEHFGEAWVKAAEQSGRIAIGRRGRTPLTIDSNNMLYVGEEEIGYIEELVGLEGKRPLETAELKVLSKQIPLGPVLGYLIGFDRLLELTKANYRKTGPNERVYLTDREFALRFADGAYIFEQDDGIASMLFAGFLQFEKSYSHYSSHLFNKKDIYRNVFEQNRIGPKFLREIDLQLDLWVDPITRTILEDMKEPTDFVGLLVRSCELLLTDWSPDETDMQYMRIKGYERIAGTVYAELIRAMRQYRTRATAAARIEMPPYVVWQALRADSANKAVDDSNPIHSLKEMEEVTYSGTGGRTGRSMVKRSRVYHENDLGVISEATKDSSDVAVVTYLTMDPNLTDLYGRTKPMDPKDGPANLLSTTSVTFPASDRDDGKRALFSSVQATSSMFSEGYRAMPLRTGAEHVIAHRSNDLFAVTAKQDGVVESINKQSVTIKYQDGQAQSYELGRRFGKVSGSVLPHELVANVKEGDKIKEGDCIAYNSHYFEVDPFNPKQTILKMGVLAKTLLMDCPDTLEDSSAISESMAEKLSTSITHVRNVIVRFDEVVHHLVTAGQTVETNDSLCLIEDAVTASVKMFDEKSLDTLKLLQANSPRAKHKGVVEKVEIFYHGDIDAIHPTTQALVVQSDKERKRLARALGRNYVSGSADESLQIDGNPLAKDHVLIRIYITARIGTGSGDKGVFGNQLKTIFRRVFSGKHETESGTPIDAIFSYSSVNNRIVDSPLIIGTTNTLLKVISKKMYEAYMSG